jgi:hypothetical protein
MATSIAQDWHQTFKPAQDNQVIITGDPIPHNGLNYLKLISTIQNRALTSVQGLHIWRPNYKPKYLSTGLDPKSGRTPIPEPQS